ncbi:Lateral organ boundaries domain containing protein [Trema orientale]|uniref:Lateral organ boundaries domain containing protein n=1 Tax=Trema orientale TaxID=63057 RepID=A0A2P5EQE7_TREOI|nr:Lateral organ boundaries domain containing protein [Trema orientale]
MSSSSSHSPCAACKFLRRKCTQECVFAPYFPPDQPQKFACVHRVYGASNVAKLLNELATAHREEAVVSLAYEAEARLRDPVYGCVGFISVLHNRLKQVQTELNAAKKELAAYIGPQAMLIPSYSLSPLQPMLGISAAAANIPGQGQQQLVIRDPANPLHQQHQPQQILIESAAQQHQQQVRFNGGFDHMAVGPVGAVGVGGFNNQMNGGGGSPSGVGGGVMSPPSLGLQGSFDNNLFNNQMQAHQTGSHHPSLDYQLQAQLLLHSQNKSEAEEN